MKDRPLSGLTVLIVEDAYLIAMEAQRMVEEAGAERVLLCSTVDDVRNLLAAGVLIDVCILDLKLDEENASPLIEEFSHRGTALLVASALDSPNTGIGVRVLKKPYQEKEFIEAIRGAIRDEA